MLAKPDWFAGDAIAVPIESNPVIWLPSATGCRTCGARFMSIAEGCTRMGWGWPDAGRPSPGVGFFPVCVHFQPSQPGIRGHWHERRPVPGAWPNPSSFGAGLINDWGIVRAKAPGRDGKSGARHGYGKVRTAGLKTASGLPKLSMSRCSQFSFCPSMILQSHAAASLLHAQVSEARCQVWLRSAHQCRKGERDHRQNRGRLHRRRLDCHR